MAEPQSVLRASRPTTLWEARAFATGRKTQLRIPMGGCVIKRPGVFMGLTRPDANEVEFDEKTGTWFSKGGEWRSTCPVGRVGDRIWIREAWAFGIHAMAAQREEDGPFVYAADGSHAVQGRLCHRWRPAVTMPKFAARTEFEVVGLRAERLNSISENDCVSEGIEEAARARIAGDAAGCGQDRTETRKRWVIVEHPVRNRDGKKVRCRTAEATDSPCEAFKAVWSAKHGAGSWDANPLVWVATLKASNHVR